MRLRVPWETRSESYTDTVVRAILAEAQGTSPARASATAALEACAGLVGRAFAVADVTGPDTVTAALTPAALEMMGRAMIRTGELVAVIDVEGGDVLLRPCISHTIAGGSRRATWTYECTTAGPTRETTHKGLAADAVVHLQYASDPGSPWQGYGPLTAASLAGRLSANVVAALADEAGGPVGHVLPIPVDGADTTIAKLKEDLAKKRGSLHLVEGGDWDNVGGGRETTWTPKRFGANPPMAMVELAKLASDETYAACGINPAVFTSGQGTAGREAYRQTLFGLIAPLGRLVSAELTAKLGAEVRLDWTELRAADVSGRARAFQSLVGGGMDMGKAAQVSGVLAPEDS